jgi:hypothetical protein
MVNRLHRQQKLTGDEFAVLSAWTTTPWLPSASPAGGLLLMGAIAVAGVVWVSVAAVQAAALEGWRGVWLQASIGLAAVLLGSCHAGLCRRPGIAVPTIAGR